MNRFLPAAVAAAVTVGVLSFPVRATVIYDNFDVGDGFSSTGANVSSFIRIAAPFTPASDAMATDIVVAMSTAAATSAAVTLSLVDDAAGHPGAVIISADISVQPGDPQIFHVTLPTPTLVTAGTQYWVRAQPGALGAPNTSWQYNIIGALGSASTLPTGLWIPSATGVTPVLRVEDNSAPMGACCAGSTCAVSLSTACNARNTSFAGIGTSCNAVGNTTTPCCKADYNQSGGLSVQDIFDFLAAWFDGNAQADFNGGGLDVQDIFDFLGAWFAGC
jgi:hypothetical protein